MINGAIYGYTNKGSVVFGVLLVDGQSEHARTIKLVSGTVNTAELHAAEYALQCIADANAEASIVTCNAYVPKMLVAGVNGYTSKPEKNKDLVESVRTAAASRDKVKIILGKSELLTRLQGLVKEYAKEHINA